MKLTHKIFLILISLLVMAGTQCQRWRSYRYDMCIGFGMTKVLGDIGDLGLCSKTIFSGLYEDFSSRRPAIFLGLRYKIDENFSTRFNISAGSISSDDRFSQNDLIKHRNLEFRSIIAHPHVQFEYSFLTERIASRYALRKASLGNLMNMYLIAGAGFLFFDPVAEIDGQKYKLRNIGTEGQGLKGEKKRYNYLYFSYHYGLGCKFIINKTWSAGFEIYCHYTVTDYLDDVGNNNYFNFTEKFEQGDISNEEYELLSKLNDRRTTDETKITSLKNEPGWKKRGFAGNDVYILSLFTIYRKLRKGRLGNPKFY